MDPIWALGLMSGTSLDGVDAAAVLTDGETIVAFGPTRAVAYTDDQRAVLRAALDWAEAHYPRNYKLTRKIDLWDIEAFRAAEAVLDATHKEALMGPALEVRNASAARPSGGEAWQDLVVAPHDRVAAVGFHGQTVLHLPEEGYTLQVGDAALLARNDLGIGLIVHDFRSADMAEGGEGAPLVPFFHHACARRAGLGGPVAFLNIGGVANVTWIDPSIADPVEACLAFDTGPGNALVDDWMAKAGGEPMDRGGAAAASGRVHRDRFTSNAARAYLDRRPPKSLDRNAFAGVLAAMEGLSVPDGAATLAAFTVDCVVEAARHMPEPPARWLVCGGGRHNATMMAGLSARLPGVEPVEAIGLDGDMLEAQAFAYLAVRVLRGLPLSAPRTTGCGRPVPGGRIFKG